MSQKHTPKRTAAPVPSKAAAASNNALVIRLVIASVIFAVSLILSMPKFLSVLLLVLTAVLAGYDIILQAIKAVENGGFLDAPVLIVLVAVLSFCIGFGVEGAALVLLYQIGALLLGFARDYTKRTALDLLRGQDKEIVDHMSQLVENENNVVMAIENVMRRSAGSILRLAMLLAVIYAIALPIITNLGFPVSIHRAMMILIVATPLSVVVSIPIAGIVGLCSCAQKGIVYGSAYSMEAMADASVAVIDKSGVFAEECPRIIAMHSDAMDQDTFLNFVAHAVYYSDQPIANALSAVYDQDYRLDVIKDFREIPGYGVELSIDGIPITFATAELFHSRGVEIPEEAGQPGQAYYMVVAGRCMGKVVISSDVNQDLETLVPELKAVGISRCVLLTEDSKEAGQEFAEALNFSEMYAQCDTAKKLRIISEIAKKTKNAVIFVYSNGIEAHSEAAVDLRVSNRARFADAVIVPEAISNLPKAKQISKRVREICVENALFAFIIKALLIFLSIIGYCNLWLAVILDFAAAVTTVLNTIRIPGESIRSNLKYRYGR